MWWPEGKGQNGLGAEFGDYIKIGENVGCLLEFSPHGTASLTFYRNGNLVGKAFDNSLPADIVYYPCVSMYYNEETLV